MMKEKLENIGDRFEDWLRSVLGRTTPNGRITIVIIMFIAFSFTSIYMTFSSIYYLGKKNNKQIEIERIKSIDVEQQDKSDSINLKKRF